MKTVLLFLMICGTGFAGLSDKVEVEPQSVASAESVDFEINPGCTLISSLDQEHVPSLPPFNREVNQTTGCIAVEAAQ